MIADKQRKSVSSRIERDKEKLVEALRKTPIVQVACQRAGTSKATFYRWRSEDQGFLVDSDKALTDGKELISDMAISQLISAIRDKNLGAIKFWLSNHHPDYKTKVEIGGSVSVSPELTPEQSALVQQALKLAGLKPKQPSEDGYGRT
jgi:hypothetical protein